MKGLISVQVDSWTEQARNKGYDRRRDRVAEMPRNPSNVTIQQKLCRSMEEAYQKVTVPRLLTR